MPELANSVEPEFVACIGIDWGDKKHAWALQIAGSTKIEQGEVLHTPEAIQEWAMGLRQRFPTGRLAVALEQLQKAKPATLQKFLQKHQCRDEAKNRARMEAMRTAVAATTDFAVVTVGCAAARAAVRLLRDLSQSIREYDQQIEKLAKAHPDFAIFDSLPGAGPVLVPRLIAAFGTQRDRYQNAAELQQYSGIAPVTEASGQQHWVHWRWSCPKFLRQTIHEWAAQSIQHCEWAAAYYQAQREEKNKSHHAAVRSLGYKWIRIVFRCWQDRTLYNNSRYEAVLQSHYKKAAARPNQPSRFEAPIQWVSCGSFQKIAFKNA